MRKGRDGFEKVDMMKVASLFSGGKDSACAAVIASKEHEIVCLLTAFSDRDDSWMFHVPCVRWTKVQAEAMGIPIIQFKTSGVKEGELEDLKRGIEKAKRWYKIEGVVTGAIASNYQRERIDKLCVELGLKHIAPLWGVDEEEFMRGLIKTNFEVVIVGVAAAGLDESWLGRKIDLKCVHDLIDLRDKYGIHLAGEGGEYESFVLFCPLFKKRLRILKSEKIWQGNSGYLDIEKIEII
jgi:diphthine-ammonia ligase